MNRKSAGRGLGIFIIAFVILIPFLKWWQASIAAFSAALFILISERRIQPGIVLPQLKFAPGVNLIAKLNETISYLNPRFRLILLTIIPLLLPFILNRYQLEVVSLALIYVTLAVGLNFIVGLCGLLALGYIAFYAVGAYTYALLSTHYGLNFFIGLPLGFLTGMAAGGLVGLPVLRLRGDYLAIVTLGFGEIVRIVLNNWDEVTRGPNGIMGIARPELMGLKLGTPEGYFLMALLLAAAVIFTQTRLAGSKFGQAWEAIREDELAAAHSGVPVFRMKMLAMMLGGAWAGAAGAMFAARMTHVSPESFTFLESVLVLCMVVLGGMGSIYGATIGALALIIIPELLRGVANYRMLAFGLVLIFMMHFRPAGLLPGSRLRIGNLRRQ